MRLALESNLQVSSSADSDDTHRARRSEMNTVLAKPRTQALRAAASHANMAMLFLGLFMWLAAPLAAATQLAPLTLAETARDADAIVVGTVTAQQTRWGSIAKRWMETDYTLQVEDVLLPSEAGVPIERSIVLTYWGGTIDDETQTISDMRAPRPGERLVVMLRRGWSEKAGFTPVVGFNYGLFSVATDAASGRSTVLDFASAPLALEAQGNVVRPTETDTASARTVDLALFSSWLRSNIGAIKTSQPPVRNSVDPRDPRLIKPFSKTPVFDTPAFSGMTSAPTMAPQIGASAKPPRAPAAPVTITTEVAPTTQTLPPRSPVASPNYVTLGYTPNLPIVVNNFPASFAPWSPEDQYQMSKWNHYASDIFRVYPTPTNTYRWGDGVFDLTGWPSSADLQKQYGRGWGANEIGVTFTRYSGSLMLEADLSLNPAFSFTLDDEWVYDDANAAQGFRQVMVHELGHMLGLDHDFNYLAEMNYMPSQFRFFGLPYMDDAAGIRGLYPGRAVALTDLAVYLYYESGYQSVTDASYPGSVNVGASFVVDNYQVENSGTSTIGTPTIEWYLTAARNYSGAYYYLGQTTYPSLAPFTYFTPSTVGRTLTVPSNVPAGSYYLSAFIRNDSAPSQASFPFSNNFAFSRFKIEVTTVPPSAPSIGVATAGNASAIVHFTPGTMGTGMLLNYTADCGGQTNTGLSSPITVFGLVNGLTYTCRVRTTTTHGVSGWSAYSNAVTPTAPMAGKAKTDFNGDGKSDIYFDNGAGGHWAYYMNGASVLSGVPMPAAAPGWTVVNFGDFNGDGKTDLLWMNNATPTQYWIYLMNGNSVIGGGPLSVAAGYVARFVGDLDGDGRSDIVFDNGTSRWVYFMNGAAVANAQPLPATAPGWLLAGMGDFNGDGRSDLIFVNGASPTQHWIYLMNGNSVIGGGAVTVGAGYSLTGAADFNGDGKADLLFTNGGAGRWIYFMNGASVSGAQPLPGAAGGWNIAGTADFNGDGKSDILWRNAGNPTQHWIYLLNGATVIGGGSVTVSAGYSPILPW